MKGRRSKVEKLFREFEKGRNASELMGLIEREVSSHALIAEQLLPSNWESKLEKLLLGHLPVTTVGNGCRIMPKEAINSLKHLEGIARR